MIRPLETVFAQVFALALVCVVAPLALGLSVLAFSPPPPPPTVSIAAFVQAWRAGADSRFTLTVSDGPPASRLRPAGTAEKLISASLARGIGLSPADVDIALAVPSIYGLRARSGTEERGQITLIDAPSSLPIGRNGQPVDLTVYLLNDQVRVPPFIATIRQRDGRYLRMEPREAWPTAWQLRLITIFALSLLAVAPLAWLGARRWTRTIRSLAARVERFDGQDAGPRVTGAGDADEFKALEQAFEAMHGRIRAQVEERLRLLMAVAHDLRTPMTSLRIRSEDVAEPLRAGFVRDLARLERMIEGILAFARLRNRPMVDAEVCLSRLAGELVAEAQARGEDVAFESGAEPVRVRGDATELMRAVDNLIRNAIRYAGSAHVTVASAGADAVLRVIDTGPGVPPELLPRLTEPFFRAETSRSVETGGIGLGLATVKAIVDHHEGTLALRTRSPGFEAEITLPQSGQRPAQTNSGDREARIPHA